MLFKNKTLYNDFVILQNQGRKEPHSQMLLQIENFLVDHDIVKPPIVFIRPEVERGMISKLKDIVAAHHGDITDDEEEATHIIHPVVDPVPEEYARPLFKRDRYVMMHWYYFPESHDSWILNNFDIQVRLDNILIHRKDNFKACAFYLFNCHQIFSL